ncbi:RsbR, positive regulator of sigma-B [Enhygromyxa salina]|uniref:RsbR, positive regulator of sigma-B n=1 Tax=Enhygromyxa salina TaxID=215803 RepID=A0A0C2D8W5_9BACT|nr:PAS domain-containing protein [Enhygromyxa salina]KIG19516.1 RsbR, positive regulator of sigma-B [Enhygromyxa salina]
MATSEDQLEALRRELAASQARERELQAEVALFKGALDAIPDSVNIRNCDATHRYANPVALEWMNVGELAEIGAAERQWRYLGEDEVSEVPPEDTPVRRVLNGDHDPPTITALHVDTRTGARRWLRGTAAPIRDPSGAMIAVVNVVRDITARRADEQALALRTEQLRERDAEKAALIRELEELVLELSAPALEVWDGVVVIPVLGALDERRGLDLVESTLAAVQRYRTRVVIVDLTGASVDSASSAEQLARLSRAVALLGAKCVLAGIRPALARFMVERDLMPAAGPTTIRAYSNLKHALRGILAR